MPRAFIVGGTGLIGRAVAGRLLASGWQVDLVGRDRARMPADIAGARFIPVDRDDAHRLSAAFGGGADLLVDCLCFTADARLRGRGPLPRFPATSLELARGR